MQQAPRYLDVVNEIKAFLFERAQGCLAAGIARQRIVIDPGFGFGKTPAHNLELLRRLEEFTQGDWPVLVGLSRKSTLASIVGRGQEADRLPASIACAVVAVFKGARIIRAHDVAATVDALKVVAALEAERAE
jgi:dihydropteroate synthase